MFSLSPQHLVLSNYFHYCFSNAVTCSSNPTRCSTACTRRINRDLHRNGQMITATCENDGRWSPDSTTYVCISGKVESLFSSSHNYIAHLWLSYCMYRPKAVYGEWDTTILTGFTGHLPLWGGTVPPSCEDHYIHAHWCVGSGWRILHAEFGVQGEARWNVYSSVIESYNRSTLSILNYHCKPTTIQTIFMIWLSLC